MTHAGNDSVHIGHPCRAGALSRHIGRHVAASDDKTAMLRLQQCSAIVGMLLVTYSSRANDFSLIRKKCLTFQFRYRLSCAGFQATAPSARILKAAPWNGFPWSVGCEIDLGGTGTLGSRHQVRLVVYDVPTKSAKELFRRLVREESVGWDAELQENVTTKGEESYRLEKAPDREPLIRWTRGTKSDREQALRQCQEI